MDFFSLRKSPAAGSRRSALMPVLSSIIFLSPFGSVGRQYPPGKTSAWDGPGAYLSGIAVRVFELAGAYRGLHLECTRLVPFFRPFHFTWIKFCPLLSPSCVDE
jgi:hypothetical protein